MLKNGTPASRAERAVRVLPVPGGPTKQYAAHMGPSELNFSGYLRNGRLPPAGLGLIDAGDILKGHDRLVRRNIRARLLPKFRAWCSSLLQAHHEEDEAANSSTAGGGPGGAGRATTLVGNGLRLIDMLAGRIPWGRRPRPCSTRHSSTPATPGLRERAEPVLAGAPSGCGSPGRPSRPSRPSVVQELGIADGRRRRAGRDQVNSGAAIPSTSSIIAMDSGRTWGSTRKPPGVRTTPVRRRSAEYSAGTATTLGRRSWSRSKNSDDGPRRMVARVRVKDWQGPSGWEGHRRCREVGSGGRI